MMREIKRRLGLARDAVLYGRRDARLKSGAEAARAWIEPAAEILPPLPPSPADAVVEAHVMCGEGQALMGIWSTWSLLRFAPDVALTVHSDGSLSDGAIARWRRVVPGLRVVGREEGLAAAERHLARFPRTLAWTRDYHFGLKLGGYYGIAGAPRLIEADTDTLTFRPPTELLDAIADDGRLMAWNRDERSAYAYARDLLAEVVGGPARTMPDRLNAGYMASFALEDPDWRVIEGALERLSADPRTDPLRYWTHQTLLALVASARGDAAGPLSQTYDVHGGPTRPDAVMRHYTGNPGIRPRFFTEGVGAVIADAKRRGQIPADFPEAP